MTVSLEIELSKFVVVVSIPKNLNVRAIFHKVANPEISQVSKSSKLLIDSYIVKTQVRDLEEIAFE